MRSNGMSQGINERVKQYRPPVIKAEGTTPSERYLAKLAEKSFLNLWSYPNPYRDQKQSGEGDGKELCDLLVVCDPYIIIFSEKTVAWPEGDLDIAWARWARRAIRDGAKQTKGAERWITEHPDRIFLDRECRNRFPIDIPLPEDRIVHRVVVTNGALEACKEYFPGSSGSLIIKPAIQRNEHWSGSSSKFEPFAVGDVDPSGTFVHVISGAALEIVMKELDTIRDFVDYLEKKATFIRSGYLWQADGEENLLAYYAIRTNKEGDHDFVLEADLNRNGYGQIKIDNSHYRSFINDPRYAAKKRADRISYLWDALIETCTTYMMRGTSIDLEGYEFDLKDCERCVRYMALESRFSRRKFGKSIKGALEVGRAQELFFRVMMSSVGSEKNETAFCLLTAQYPIPGAEDVGYQTYRMFRSNFMQIYALGILERFPHLKRVIGISCEPLDAEHGRSEEIIYVGQFEWTAEQRHAIRQDCEKCGFLREDFKTSQLYEQEFPEIEPV